MFFPRLRFGLIRLYSFLNVSENFYAIIYLCLLDSYGFNLLGFMFSLVSVLCYFQIEMVFS